MASREYHCIFRVKGIVMVFNATFNNFSYIVRASFIGEPSTCRKSLTDLIIFCRMEYTSPEWDSISQRKW